MDRSKATDVGVERAITVIYEVVASAIQAIILACI